MEFKTDNTELFNFSLEQIREYGWTVLSYTYDLHHHEEMNKNNIMTEYEEKFSAKGNPGDSQRERGGWDGREAGKKKCVRRCIVRQN